MKEILLFTTDLRRGNDVEAETPRCFPERFEILVGLARLLH
jgi:hypothetical protein